MFLVAEVDTAEVDTEVDLLMPQLLLEAGKNFIYEDCFITNSLHLHRLKHRFLFQGEKMSRVYIIM